MHKCRADFQPTVSAVKFAEYCAQFAPILSPKTRQWGNPEIIRNGFPDRDSYPCTVHLIVDGVWVTERKYASLS